LTKCNF